MDAPAQLDRLVRDAARFLQDFGEPHAPGIISRPPARCGGAGTR
jgi:hypothetical protein